MKGYVGATTHVKISLDHPVSTAGTSSAPRTTVGTHDLTYAKPGLLDK